MRSREQIRTSCQEIWKEPDPQKRAFKLFMVDVELNLDIRDYLETIAKDAYRRNMEADGKLPPRQKKP